MKPKIAIIGANEAIDILICKAKEKGYETHVFAWQNGDPGEKSADVFYPVSTADKEEILNICRGIGIVGIASVTSDFAVSTVNYVARNLDLVGNCEITDAVARNKFLMRKAFRDNGVYTPWFTKVGKDTDLSFMEDHNYPVIVKPTDRWSSMGVTCVRSFKELQQAVDYAAELSLTDEAIIEDFMEGPEYSAECICQDGVCHILTVTKKLTTGYPHYVESGHMQPADIPAEKLPYVHQVVKKAVAALCIENSAAHVEFRCLENGEIGIIEIGARMGGDYIGTDLVRLSTGYDYVGMVIDMACGKKLDFTPNYHYKSSRVHFIMDQTDYETFQKLELGANEVMERSVIFNTNFDHEIMNSSDRYGYYILCEKE